MFLQKALLQVDLKKFLRLKQFKILFLGHMLLVISTVKKLLKSFTKKNCKKQIKELRVEKAIKRKGDQFYVKRKGYYSSFNS